MLSHLRQIFTTILFVCLSAATAFAAEWQVERTTKEVMYTVDRENWVSLQRGMAVPNNAWVSTGPRGRLALTRRTERLAIEPKTLAAVITREGLLSRKTEVVQRTGQIAADIEKRSRPHTYVHTPLLAAVVKGRSFTVTVTSRDASVSVDRGLVQVTSFTGGQSTDVGPGQQARVDQAQNIAVAGNGAPSVSSVEPTQAAVPAVGQPSPIGTGLGVSSFSGQTNGDNGSGNGNGDGRGGGDGNGGVKANGGGNGNGAGNGNGGRN
ncbi:hypothetical protein ABID21_004279 [Pseudorhizobium tarimense]|uniref:FecR family protein n=1 Tax=Pseudorhizobium tarimense TaxID=1079109 RepID=A0ABV2HC89_9HYPH|nr:hypothetical protein [Pseudorhizobium tarimense]MCJ8521193.1 hypothetical protein [Pseudorhizobium tarimense]